MSDALIIDSSYLIFRSYFAYPHLNTGDKPTGAFYGFAKAVLKMVKDYKPRYIYFAKDLPTPTWRHLIYSEYKAGRKDADENMVSQIPVIHEWSKLVASDCLAIDGYEADDLINTLACRLSEDEKIGKVLIFSADRDLYQIFVRDKIGFIAGDKIFEKSHFEEKYGVKAAQWIDYKALVGDPSDNLKGVEKVGPKTAAAILQKVGSLSDLFEAMKGSTDYQNSQAREWLISPKNQPLVQKISDARDKIELNRQLAALNDIPELQFHQRPFDLNAGIQIFETYEFNSLINELKTTENNFIDKEKDEDLTKHLSASQKVVNTSQELF